MDKQKLIDYIYEWGYTYGRYYHTTNPEEKASEVMTSPEEFVEHLLNPAHKKEQPKTFEIDKVYKTKFATGDEFLIKEVVLKANKKDIDYFKGYYVGKEHIGICPLNFDRL